MKKDISLNYISKLKIKAKRMKLIDSLKLDKYKSKPSQKILEAEITLLNELLKD